MNRLEYVSYGVGFLLLSSGVILMLSGLSNYGNVAVLSGIALAEPSYVLMSGKRSLASWIIYTVTVTVMAATILSALAVK